MTREGTRLHLLRRAQSIQEDARRQRVPSPERLIAEGLGLLVEALLLEPDDLARDVTIRQLGASVRCGLVTPEDARARVLEALEHASRPGGTR